MNAHRKPVRALVALGSNLGDRRVELELALARLSRASGIRVLAVSSWHETEPVGGPAGQSRYLNGVAQLETELGPRELLERLQALEARAGRDRAREVRNGPRRLDLDLLFHGDAHLDESDLQLPHPRLEQREFVLAPLCELEPDRRLAQCRLSVREQLRASASRHSERAACCVADRAPEGSIGRAVLVPRAALARAKHRLRADHGRLARRTPRARAPRGRGKRARGGQRFRQSAAIQRSRGLRALPARLRGRQPHAGRRRLRHGFHGDARTVLPGRVLADGGLAPELWLEPGPSASGLEGSRRPGHFRGVATIVARLFELIEPARAYFGQKDFQQTLVVSDLARARGAPQVVTCPTSREPAGLARSSRNQLLSATEREHAAGLFEALGNTREAWSQGMRDAAALSDLLRTQLREREFEVEYGEIRDPEHWSAQAPRGLLERAIALLAVRVGRTRLIDNLRLDEPTSGVR